MTRPVEITFDCIPLRAVGRFDIPIDASPEDTDLYRRLHVAAEKHGVHNAYYLAQGRCAFHLTNDPQIGLIEFGFEGTVLTDTADQQTQLCDLAIELLEEVCDWLTAPVVEWFGETVRNAVRVEFDRYIAAGDLAKTIERMRRIEAESDSHGGYTGMGL